MSALAQAAGDVLAAALTDLHHAEHAYQDALIRIGDVLRVRCDHTGRAAILDASNTAASLTIGVETATRHHHARRARR